MKYRHLFLVVIFTMSLPNKIFSQQALNFTMVDTKGKKWNLFDELAKGNKVVLDFFFADCTPCQKLTPAMVKLYEQYKTSSDSVLVLGISDRDMNSKLDKFESDFGVTYPSCGVQGGGDTITDLYKNYFSFPSWPMYAVICPNKEITWNVERDLSLSKVYSTIDSCTNTLGLIKNKPVDFSIYPNPAHEILNLNFKKKGEYLVSILSSDGRLVLQKDYTCSSAIMDIGGLKNGMFFVHIQSNYKNQISKLIKE